MCVIQTWQDKLSSELIFSVPNILSPFLLLFFDAFRTVQLWAGKTFIWWGYRWGLWPNGINFLGHPHKCTPRKSGVGFKYGTRGANSWPPTLHAFELDWDMGFMDWFAWYLGLINNGLLVGSKFSEVALKVQIRFLPNLHVPRLENSVSWRDTLKSPRFDKKCSQIPAP